MNAHEAVNGDEGGTFEPLDSDEKIFRIRTAIAVLAETIHRAPLGWRERKQDDFLEVQVWQVGSRDESPSARSFGHRGLRVRVQGAETFAKTRMRLYAALLFDVQIWASECLLVADENGVLERNATRIVREWVERTSFVDVAKAALAGALWRRRLSSRRPSIRPKP